MTTTVFLFSGQGSQYHQMGRELFEHEPVFARALRDLDAVVLDLTGESVIARMYDDGRSIADPFDRLRHSHPAIFMIELAVCRLLADRGIEPDYVLGASLGEFAAAAVAGVLPAEELLRSVVAQARLAEAHCPPGRMLAVLGDPAMFGADPQRWAGSELAAVSYDAHFVVAGATEALERIRRDVQSAGVAAEFLPVPHAFHSSHLDGFAAGFIDIYRGLDFQAPRVPFVSAVHPGFRERFDAQYFWDVVRRPIQFPGAVRQLVARAGAEDLAFVDVGPGGTLAGFTSRVLGPGARCYPILSAFQRDRHLLTEVAALRPRRATPAAADDRGDMHAFLFPGQGSQHKGMGAALFDDFPELVATADRVLGYSIRELCLTDPDRRLTRTEFTQPALFVVNALTYLARVRDTGVRPDYVAGHSLGEYNAHFAAGTFDFETGLRLVQRRGLLMSRAAEGGMAGVIGLTVEEVRDVLTREGLTDLDVANHNSPRQVVVAGPREVVRAAQKVFEAAGAKHYIPLNVSGAFHSRLMRPTRQEFAADLRRAEFRPPQIPVIANVTARPGRPGETAATLEEQVTGQVRWNDTIRYLLAVGVTEFTEVGPGKVLAGLVAKIRAEAEPLVLDPEPAPALVSAPAPVAVPRIPAQRTPPVTAASVPVPVPVSAPVSVPAQFRSEPANGGSAKMRASLTAQSLGSADFRRDYNLSHAYVAGGMYRGISSTDLVIRMGRAGLLAFFGTAMLGRADVDEAVRKIQQGLPAGAPYGVNLVHSPADPGAEEAVVDVCLARGVRVIEASAFMSITAALVRYRAKGLRRGPGGTVTATNRIIAKLSRPEVARPFLSPAPAEIVARLAAAGAITADEAALVREIPLAEDLCVEADSGGHTDRGVLAVLLPAIIDLRDRLAAEHGYRHRVRVGAAGGLGTPAAVAVAFMLGADFVLTGSINQCTVEAGTSDPVKDLLEQAGVHDTAYAPAGDMFEIGAQVQVLQRGVFFPGRANRLYQLYRHFEALDDIDAKTRTMLAEKYFRRPLEDVWTDVKAYQPAREIERAERNPKYRMSLIFRWYLARSTMAALDGDPDLRIDYQIHCGPAMGGLNEWLRGTELEHWRHRHADELGRRLMQAAAELIERRFAGWFGATAPFPTASVPGGLVAAAAAPPQLVAR
ncbi:ACP S-malonyltransferase [Dactylosporangium sp. NPDC049525]|uniref:ACP S-malonyltransferase n=1 Tax=Dactylosporangium sp. NPDC049525 TaxID=3154730 RepID=UPI003416493F